MLRYVAAAFLFAGLIGLVGCDSGGGSSFPDSGNLNGVSTPVQITLTQTQNIRAVTIQHEIGNSGNLEQVYSQDFSTSAPPDPIDFTVNLISGDHYLVEATTVDSSGNQRVTSQDFIAGSSTDSFNTTGLRSQGAAPHSTSCLRCWRCNHWSKLLRIDRAKVFESCMRQIDILSSPSRGKRGDVQNIYL